MIEQAKFTYSPLGKAFEKQIKTIEDQGQKQVEALNTLKQVNANNDYDYKNKLLDSKERGIFKNIYNKKLDKIEELSKKIDGDNLVHTIISTGKTNDFTKKDDPLTLLNKIKKREIITEEAKESQKDFDKYLKRVRKEGKNNEQKKTLANLNMLFNGRNDSINFI